MDPQNIDRRDSKKSKGGVGKGQGRGGSSNPSNGGSGSGGGGKPTAGEKQRSHSQKAGKPYREIYKPPSLRSSKNRNSDSSEQQSQVKGSSNDDSSGNAPLNFNKTTSIPLSPNGAVGKNQGNGGNNSIPLSKQNGSFSENMIEDSSLLNSSSGYSLFGNGGNTANGASSVPSSPLISNRMQNGFGLAAANQRIFNVNAKEFQFLPLHQQQQQQQQLSNFLSQFDPNLFYNANSPILASSGCYPLKQSKSSGNMNLLLQQHQQHQQQQAVAQAAALQQLQNAIGFNFPLQLGNLSSGNNGGAGNQFNRLSQSKSSGNVPGAGGNKPRVRFDDEDDFDDGDDLLAGQLGNYLASLKLNGDTYGASPAASFPRTFPMQQQQPQGKPNKSVPLSPQPVLKSSLQKSRTGFYLNLYGNQQQQQQVPLPSPPNKPLYGFGTSGTGLGNPVPAHLGSNNFAGKSNVSAPQQHPSPGGSGIVKRSRSFGPGSHHLPRASATSLLSASTQSPPLTGHSIYSDFCITKWPRVVQELVTAAVTGVERIPARNWIEMVNGIFEAMLCDYRPGKKDRNNTTGTLGSKKMTFPSAPRNGSVNLDKSAVGSTESTSDMAELRPDNEDSENDEGVEDDDDTDLTYAAVHIFLYFIQREKDRTVMESLLNTCFASFQRLSTCSMSSISGGNKPSKSQQQMILAQKGKPSISRQWSNFLRFLSTLYSQVKQIRRQKQSQQQPGQSMDEMSFSLLALLCDSCLATLRSPQSYTAEMMGCLFTVLTSIGRDMEGTFPLKMKQLLAAVRDALLGIGPYHQQQQQHKYNGSNNGPMNSTTNSKATSHLSPIVQKTLMQLIELHAANWQLPASAVRYYYSSVSSGAGGSSSKSNSSMNNSVSPASPTTRFSPTQKSKSNSSSNSRNPNYNITGSPASNSAEAVPPNSSSSSISTVNDDDKDFKEDTSAEVKDVISQASDQEKMGIDQQANTSEEVIKESTSENEK